MTERASISDSCMDNVLDVLQNTKIIEDKADLVSSRSLTADGEGLGLEDLVDNEQYAVIEPELNKIMDQCNSSLPPVPAVLFPEGFPYGRETATELIIGGDAILDKRSPEARELIISLMNGTTDEASAVSRGVRKTWFSLWPNGKITYRFGDSVSSDVQDDFREYATLWSEETDGTISFEEISNSSWNQFLWAMGWSYHLQVEVKDISPAAGKCVLGYGAWKYMNLDDGFSAYSPSSKRRVVTHELGHALTLIHENQRYDRDKYITVVYENIIDDYESQYDLVPWILAGTVSTSYDYHSIMHYWAISSFTIDGKAAFKFAGTNTYLTNSDCGSYNISDTDASFVKGLYE